MVSPTLSPEVIRSLPKVLLHDHLDGGLRPATIIELAERHGYTGLPTTDPEELGRWFVEAADSGSLVRYLETFDHTVGVMQTAEGLERVAAECAIDLAADGVVYAEVRFAPEQHLTAGLTLEQVVEAVLEGFRRGTAEAAEKGNSIEVGTLVTAMRHANRSPEIAQLTLKYRDAGVVGFDIAGAEAGFPPSQHLEAFRILREANFHYTVHAGEAFGPASVWEALALCGAERLGHGVRLIEDITFAEDGTAQLGELAAAVRDRRIPLELAPSSNVQTAAAPSIAEHPIRKFLDLGFRATLNTDNRLMSGCSMSSEMTALVEQAGFTLADLEKLTVNGMKSAFISYDRRVDLINRVIRPGYAAV